jgi:3-oxoacyl-(acyl-carrier-protein) synthase
VRAPAAGRRVVVTGLGVLAPGGTGPEAFWQGLRTTPEDRQQRRVDDFDATAWMTPQAARRADRFTQLALAAGQMAMDDRGAAPVPEPGRCGVHLGTGMGGVSTLEAQVGVLAERGPKRVSPFTIPMVMPNAGAAALSLRFGLQGPCETITTACAAGTLALEDAGLTASDVRAVNAHGTSTPLNDAAEGAAVIAVFGPHGVPVSGIKGVTGHSLGAAGALEAVSVLLSFAHRELPPTLGTAEVDPALELDVVLEPRPWEPGPTLSNSFGFGGHNGALVLGPA